MQEEIEKVVAQFVVDYGVSRRLHPDKFGDDTVGITKELVRDGKKETVNAMVSVDDGNVLVEGGVEGHGGWEPPKGQPLNPCGELLGPVWAPFPKIIIPLADPTVFDKLVVVLDRRFTEGR